jgi:zinc finger BED domain-containing protein 1 (E3 SUMO-protein ligase ZBED1)
MKLKEQIDKRFARVMDPKCKSFDSVYTVATFLDPRFKGLLTYLKIAEAGVNRLRTLAETYVERVDDEVQEVEEQEDLRGGRGGTVEGETQQNQNPATKKSIAQAFLEDYSSKEAAPDFLELEIETYKKTKLLPRYADPLKDFWIPNQDRFPVLYKMALDHLVVPATSAASERLFSRAAYVCKDRRTNFSSSNLERFALLNYSDEHFQHVPTDKCKT